MKKILAILLVSSSLSNVFADCCNTESFPKVKIGGKFEFGGVSRIQDSLTESQKKMSGNLDNATLFSSAALTADISNEHDELKYGATLGISPLHKKAKPNPSYLYLENFLGRVELGASKTVMSQMQIGGWDLSCGVADDWSSYYSADPDKRGIYYMEDFSNNLDFSYRKSEYVEFSRKISYTTPRVYGLQLGVSYIPDTSNSGAVGYSTDNIHYRNPGAEDIYSQKTAATPVTDLTKIQERDLNRVDVTHGFAGGVNYEYEIGADAKVNLAFVGEYAKAKDFQIPVADNEKKADLLNWILGAQVKYQNLNVAGSFRNAGNSFTSKAQDGDDDARKSYGFDVGLKYTFGSAAASLNYFYSDAKNNKLSAISVAADYDLAPGLTPYVQAVKFDGVGKFKDVANSGNLTEDKKPNGYLFIIGTKLKF